jgi:hypothetical protein
LLHSYAARPDQALAYYRRALSVREGIGYMRGVMINHHNIGDTHFHAGQWPKAWVAFSRSRELAAEMGWERGIVLNDVFLAYLSAAQDSGSVDDILAITERAVALRDGEIASTGAWLAGRLLLERSDLHGAKLQLQHALELATEWELNPLMCELETMLAQTLPTESDVGSTTVSSTS